MSEMTVFALDSSAVRALAIGNPSQARTRLAEDEKTLISNEGLVFQCTLQTTGALQGDDEKGVRSMHTPGGDEEKGVSSNDPLGCFHKTVIFNEPRLSSLVRN